MNEEMEVHRWISKDPRLGARLVVRVITLTYNHEKFIGQCMKSVLAQKGDFAIEYFIFDDFSRDSTVDVVLGYINGLAGGYGLCSQISLCRRKANVGVVRSLADAIGDLGQSSFVTFCEGDDYWSNEKRIAKHLKFIDSESNISFSFNDLMLLDYKENAFSPHPDQARLTQSTLSGEDLAACNFIGNFSCCFYRSKIVAGIPRSLFDMYSVDWAFNLCCSKMGKIGHLRERLSIYRQHDAGEWTGKCEIKRSRELLSLIDNYDAFFDQCFHEQFAKYKQALINRMRSRFGVNITGGIREDDGFGTDHHHDGKETANTEQGTVPGYFQAITHSRNHPLVSIIIPSYCHVKSIKSAIESALLQDYPNIEILVSDDASTDNSWDVISQYSQQGKFHLFRQVKNLGPVENLVFLIQKSHGDYIALLNSDDCWLPGKLTQQVNVMEEGREIGACFTWAEIVDESGSNISPDEELWRKIFIQPNRSRSQWLRHFYDHGNCLCHPSLLIRKSVYEQIGYYNPFLRQLPDFEFWIRVAKSFEISIIPRIFVKHIRTGSNTSTISRSNIARSIREYEYIYNGFFDDMSDELFLEAFGDVLRIPLARMTHEHICCEKLFLLLEAGNCRQAACAVGMRKFMEIASRQQIADILKREYAFGSAIFHQRSGGENSDIPQAISGSNRRLRGLLNAKNYSATWRYYKTYGFMALIKKLSKTFAGQSP